MTESLTIMYFCPDSADFLTSPFLYYYIFTKL